MTVVTSAVNGSSNVYDSDALSALASSTLSGNSSTQFTLSDSDFTLTAHGTGLTYSSSHPSGGTITSLTEQATGASTAQTWSGFSISVSSLWHAITSGDVTTFDSLLFGGNDTFNSSIATIGTNTFSGYDGNDTFNMLGADGSDRLSGGSGNDTFNFTNRFSLQDTVDGGSGTDTLNLNGDYLAHDGEPGLQFISSTLTNVEIINLAGGHSYDLATDNATVASGAILTVNASTLLATDALNFNGAAETNGTFAITGGAGNDTFTGGTGNDTFNGGGGTDTVNYAHATASVNVDLNVTTPQAVAGAGNDSFTSIEGIIGSAHNDTLTGNSADNYFAGNDGNDVLTGNAGNDVLDGGAGDDVLDGGTGSDTVSYQSAFFGTGVTVDLSITGPQAVGSNAGTDTLISIENIIGSDGNDTLIGNSGDNIFNGGGGTNTVSYQNATSGVTVNLAITGPQAVGGGQGNDTFISIQNIIGSNYDDTFIGNSNADSFSGGNGNDTADFSHATGPIIMQGGPGGPQLSSIENIIGSSSDDQLIGGSHAVGTTALLSGGDGNDRILDGGFGADTVLGGAGDDIIFVSDFDATDTIDGGSGNDTVSLSTGTSLMTFGPTSMENVETLVAGFSNIKTNDATVAAGATLTVIADDNFLKFDGSAETDGSFNITTGGDPDTIIGGARNDTISTGAGLDTIDISFGGNDIVHAGVDNDTIRAGAALTAADTVDGGAGFDTLALNGDYSAGLNFGATTIVNVEVLQLSAGHSYRLSMNDANVAATQKLTVNGSALGVGDVLTFDGSHETDGNFAVTGGSGNDVLTGGAGNDTLAGSGGNDALNLSFGGDDLAQGEVGDDIFILGAAFTAADRIDGGVGYDTVRLSGDYSAGVIFNATTMTNVEQIIFVAGNSYNLTLTNTSVASGETLTINGSGLGATDSLTLDGSQQVPGGNFVFLGGAGNDVLLGGGGNDTFTGGAGDDTLNGAYGNDTASYATATGGVTIDLSLSTAQAVGGGQGNDTLISIEKLIGSNFNDTLSGNSGDNTLNGGAGIDTVSYANATGGVNVSLSVSTAQAVGGGQGNDTLLSIENLTGSNFNDVLRGSAANNVISGLGGDDTIDLSARGNDIAQGGDGNDSILMGGALTFADQIDGGVGNDTVILNGDYSLGVVFGPQTMVNVETINLVTGHSYKLTTNDATVASGQTLTVNGGTLGAGDTLNFNGSHEHDGNFIIAGGASNDVLTGGAGNDTLTGGLGADHLTGGSGTDTLIYASAAQSTGANYDTITFFDFAADKFDLETKVLAIDTAITAGALTVASFDSDLAASVNKTLLGKHHAVIFTPDSGDFAGKTFLVIDTNGVAGYQAGKDIVIQLDHAAHLSSLNVTDFV